MSMISPRSLWHNTLVNLFERWTFEPALEWNLRWSHHESSSSPASLAPSRVALGLGKGTRTSDLTDVQELYRRLEIDQEVTEPLQIGIRAPVER